MAERERASVNGAEERKAVLEVLTRFVEGLRKKDTSIWNDLFYPKSNLYAFRKDEGGNWIPNYRTKEDMIAVLEVEERALDQIFWNPTVLIRGPVATIWSPYELRRGGETSHCGIDSFSLVKIDGDWKIFSIIFTAEARACRELQMGVR